MWYYKTQTLIYNNQSHDKPNRDQVVLNNRHPLLRANFPIDQTNEISDNNINICSVCFLTSDMSSGSFTTRKRLGMTISLVCTCHLNAANKIILFSYFYTFKIIKLVIACEASVIYSHGHVYKLLFKMKKKIISPDFVCKFQLPL